MLSATGKCHTCGNESWVDECAECWKAHATITLRPVENSDGE